MWHRVRLLPDHHGSALQEPALRGSRIMHIPHHIGGFMKLRQLCAVDSRGLNHLVRPLEFLHIEQIHS